MISDTSSQLVSLIREMAQIEMAKGDATSICQIQSINVDKTVNVVILPDMTTVINNIVNSSNSELLPGDNAVLYKIKNQISNSFIIAKCGAPREKTSTIIQNIGGEGGAVAIGGGGEEINKTFIEDYRPNDWTSVSNNGQPPYRLNIANHGLVNPYVAMVAMFDPNAEEKVYTPIVVETKLWPSGTVCIYITLQEIPENYWVRVYLKGE